jgi:hypothetical protein
VNVLVGSRAVLALGDAASAALDAPLRPQRVVTARAYDRPRPASASAAAARSPARSG